MTLAFAQQARVESPTVAPPHQQPLPGALREEFAERFGAPFDDVHVAPTAASQGADAMTVGGGIAFGEAAYRPESGWSREHIAHELDHVVRQRGGTGGPT